MSPEIVALVLGLSVCGVMVLAIWAWRMERIETRITEQQVTNLHTATSALGDSMSKRSDEIANLQARIKKLEDVMRIDGMKITAEANRANLPAFMK